MHRLTPSANWPVFQRNSLKTLERQLQARSPTPLMQGAGLAAAQLALAMAPHAQRIWVAAGPGNNGGDGLEAAMHLHLAGKTVRVSLLIDRDKQALEAQAALAKALQAGLTVQTEPPSEWIAGMGLVVVFARRVEPSLRLKAEGLAGGCIQAFQPDVATEIPAMAHEQPWFGGDECQGVIGPNGARLGLRINAEKLPGFGVQPRGQIQCQNFCR